MSKRIDEAFSKLIQKFVSEASQISCSQEEYLHQMKCCIDEIRESMDAVEGDLKCQEKENDG